MTCIYPDCGKEVAAWGYCQKHYKRTKKYGSPHPKKNDQAPLSERFWRFVDRKSEDECWNWIGNKLKSGYGQISIGAKKEMSKGAHRVSWELANDKSIPDGMYIMHKCDNPSCVNPNHLTIGTAKENTQDMIQKGRKKTVAPLGEENGKSLLNAEKVLLIRASTLNHAALGRQLNVSPNCIRGVRTGRTWSHIK